MKKTLTILLLFFTLLSFGQDYRVVDWKTIPTNIQLLGIDTFKFDADPIDYNDVGVGLKDSGYYFVDFISRAFLVIDYDATTITVVDLANENTAPNEGQIGSVYKPIADGNSLFGSIGGVDVSVLDELSRWKGVARDNELFGRAIKTNSDRLDSINEFTQPQDSFQLDPNIPLVGDDFTDYTFKADSATKMIVFQHGFGNTNYVNASLSIPFINTTGDTIYRGTPVSGDSIDFSIGRFLPDVAVTDVSSVESARAFGGLVRDDTPPNEFGVIQRLNFLVGYNTSGFDVDDPVYVSKDSTLTSVPPNPPYYTVFVGRVVISDAVNGVIEVIATAFTGNDTDVSLQGILNGVITQKQAVRDTVIGGVIYFETYNEDHPDEDLPFMASKFNYKLNTTSNTGTNGYARVALTFGTSSSSQVNYIYIENPTTAPALAVSTTAFPEEGIRVAECGVFDLATHQTYGFAYFQRFNNSVDGSVADGLLSKAGKRMRLEGSKYEPPGIDPTVTIVVEGASKDSLNIYTTSGIIWQFNRQSYQAQTQKRYLWLNSPTGERWITDLNEVDSTEAGIDLHGGNNRRYGLNIFAIQNSGDFNDWLAVSAPIDYYSSDQNAIDDVNGYAVTNVSDKYSKVATRLFRVVVNYSTADNGTITNLLGSGGFQNERGFLLGSGGSGSGSGAAVTNFSDGDFTIYNSLDPTKIAAFDASSITTGTTRHYTFPDEDGIVIVDGILSDSTALSTNGSAGHIQIGDQEITINVNDGDSVNTNELITDLNYTNNTLEIIEGGVSQNVLINPTPDTIGVGYYNKLIITDTIVSVTYPKDMHSSEYPLDIKAYYLDTISYRTSIPISIGVWDLEKTASGFTIKLKKDFGFLEYFAQDTSSTQNFIVDNYIPYGVQELTGTAPNWDVDDGISATITLTGETSITMQDLIAGSSGNLTVTNPTTSYGITFLGYNYKISEIVIDSGDKVLTSGGSKIDLFSWYYDGTYVIINGQLDYQ